MSTINLHIKERVCQTHISGMFLKNIHECGLSVVDAVEENSLSRRLKKASTAKASKKSI